MKNPITEPNEFIRLLFVSGLSVFASHLYMETYSAVTCVLVSTPSSIGTVSGVGALVMFVLAWVLFSGKTDLLMLSRILGASAFSVFGHRMAMSIFLNGCGQEIGGSLYSKLLFLTLVIIGAIWVISGKTWGELSLITSKKIAEFIAKRKEQTKEQWLRRKEKRAERKRFEEVSTFSQLELKQTVGEKI